MNGLRRYEILVPLLFNDGRPVPEPLLAQTFVELREKFAAASWETQIVRGAWEPKRLAAEHRKDSVGSPRVHTTASRSLLRRL